MEKLELALKKWGHPEQYIVLRPLVIILQLLHHHPLLPRMHHRLAKPLYVCKIEDLDSQRGVKDISWLAIGKRSNYPVRHLLVFLHLCTHFWVGLVIYRNFTVPGTSWPILMNFCMHNIHSRSFWKGSRLRSFLDRFRKKDLD